jgi:hypothetical protein
LELVDRHELGGNVGEADELGRGHSTLDGNRAGVGDSNQVLFHALGRILNVIIYNSRMDAQKIATKESATTGIANSREEQIRKRAYELYLARKGGAGSDVQDWLQAEAEIIWKLDH